LYELSSFTQSHIMSINVLSIANIKHAKNSESDQAGVGVVDEDGNCGEQ